MCQAKKIFVKNHLVLHRFKVNLNFTYFFRFILPYKEIRKIICYENRNQFKAKRKKVIFCIRQMLLQMKIRYRKLNSNYLYKFHWFVSQYYVNLRITIKQHIFHVLSDLDFFSSDFVQHSNFKHFCFPSRLLLSY